MSEITRPSSREEVLSLSDHVHDNTIDAEGITYNKDALSLDIPLYQHVMQEKVCIRKNFWKKHYYVPVTEGCLRVLNVSEYKIIHDQGIKYYTINSISIGDNNKIILHTNESMYIEIIAKGINISLHGSNEKRGYQKYCKGLIFSSWETDIRKEIPGESIER